MSVSSILTSMTNQVSTLLGSDWHELRYIYNLEDNDGRLKSGYGVGASDGSSVSGTNKAITLDFDFFIVLMKGFSNRNSDTKEREVLSEIYDKFEEINENIFQKKLNNTEVLLVQNISYESPKRIDKSTIAVAVNFTVKYRNQTI